MKRITPRTCLWPLTGVLCITFALSLGLTYRSNHYCFAGTCGEWLFPTRTRLHVVVWYCWISLSVTLLGFRAFQPSLRRLIARSVASRVPILGKQLRVSGLLIVLWIGSLYGILIGLWWTGLRDYFEKRGLGLPGNNLVAAVALTGHLADVTTGMVLLPVSRHSALASFFKISPTTTSTFHLVQAYVLFSLIIAHASLYAAWATIYTRNSNDFRHILPVLNPTYLYNEIWPGESSSLGVWRASLIFTGSVSSLIMLVMFFTSLPCVRRTHFNLFYFTHLFGIVAVVVVCLHASTMFYCSIPGLSMWLLDWLMRVSELREKLDSRLVAIGNGWYTLSLVLPRKRLSGCACHSPLAHFYIHHSETSIREIHPFTTITHLASKKINVKNGEQSIQIQFLFRQSVSANEPQTLPSQPPLRKSTQWTSKLAALADDEEAGRDEGKTTASGEHKPDLIRSTSELFKRGVSTSVRLEGPYFTPANPEAFRTVVCLVAGTGLSGAIAIFAAFQAHRARLEQTSNVRSGTNQTCTPAADRAVGCWDRCIVIWTVREKDFVHMPFFDTTDQTGLEFRVYKTGGTNQRPDMSKYLAEVCGKNGSETWCYISGPSGFIDAAENACNQIDGLTRFAARWD